jgi:uncharacterized membrane protein YgdD (TMEM256/DUF423 family)
MNQITAAAFALALAVVIGAFGAHGVRDMIGPEQMRIYETGVSYHFYHALGMLAVPLLAQAGLINASAAKWGFIFFSVGIVCFSGSLYILAITGQTLWGAVAPIGGTSFIAGWMAIVYGSIQRGPIQRKPPASS